VARFSGPMVASAIRVASDPFDIDCPSGRGTGSIPATGVYDLEREGSAGLRCQFALKQVRRARRSARSAASGGSPSTPAVRGCC